MLTLKNLHLSLICSTFMETDLKTGSSGLVSRPRNDSVYFITFAIDIKSCLHEELRCTVSLTSLDLKESVVSCI